MISSIQRLIARELSPVIASLPTRVTRVTDDEQLSRFMLILLAAGSVYGGFIGLKTIFSPILVRVTGLQRCLRVKCCDIFFETLNVPALCVKPQSFLALFGSGLTTGLSVDLGKETTEINPVYEGGSFSYANMITNFAGVDIERYILDCLEKRDVDLGPDSEAVVQDIWNLVYITENCAVTKEQYKKEYKLPNGDVIDVSDLVFMAGEMYFQPELVLGEKSNRLPIHDAMMTAILKLDDELQTEMYDKIITHGGYLTMPGFNKRLAREMEGIIQRPVTILDTSEPYSVAWMGGAVFAGMQGSTKLWVHKKQYEEYGEKAVRTKFL